MSLEHPENKENPLDKEATEIKQEDPDHFLVHPVHNLTHEKEDKKRLEELDQILLHPEQEEAPTVSTSSERKASTSPSNSTRMITNGVDFLPIIGSAKMLIEGVLGKQYGTNKELTGKVRILHGASGLLFLALDVTGVGAIASEAGKLGLKLSLRTLKKETVEKVFESQVIKEEGVKLATRGNERVKRKEELQDM